MIIGEKSEFYVLWLRGFSVCCLPSNYKDMKNPKIIFTTTFTCSLCCSFCVIWWKLAKKQDARKPQSHFTMRKKESCCIERHFSNKYLKFHFLCQPTPTWPASVPPELLKNSPQEAQNVKESQTLIQTQSHATATTEMVVMELPVSRATLHCLFYLLSLLCV